MINQQVHHCPCGEKATRKFLGYYCCDNCFRIETSNKYRKDYCGEWFARSSATSACRLENDEQEESPAVGDSLKTLEAKLNAIDAEAKRLAGVDNWETQLQFV